MASAKWSHIDRTSLLTTAEVAALLRVSERTVRRLGQCGRLERHRLGYRTVRYTAQSVRSLLSSPYNDRSPAANQAPGKAASDDAARFPQAY